MNRSHFSHLPQSEELDKIMQNEASRSLPSGKEEAHFVEFTAIKRLLVAYDLMSDFFEKIILPEEVVKKGILEEGEALVQDLADRISTSGFNEEQRMALDGAYAYLAEEDSPHPSDLIFVFGAKTPLRIEKAVELYNAGLAPQLVISGGNPFYSEGAQDTEAERYAGIAMAAGVPKSSIMIEPEAITVADNVRRSLNFLEGSGVHFRSLIIVNSPYVQRRGWAFFMKYLPEGVSVYRVNCGTAEKYRAGEWWQNDEGLKVVLHEWIKLKVAVSLNTA